MRRTALALVAVAGATLAVATSVASAMTAHDAIHLITIAGGTALGAAVIGGCALYALRRRSVGSQ